jgi:hypothetical protein
MLGRDLDRPWKGGNSAEFNSKLISIDSGLERGCEGMFHVEHIWGY